MGLIRNLGGNSREEGCQEKTVSTQRRQRTFKENIQDQIAAHKAKIEELENVLNSMSPEVERFVEALQKANL